jgi:hypothetical protein
VGRRESRRPPRLPPDGIPNWHRVDRSRFSDDVLRALPVPGGPGWEEGITTSDLAEQLELTRYEQDRWLRPQLHKHEGQGLAERVGPVGGAGRHHRWRRTGRTGPSTVNSDDA